jgi:hypothetical protein
VARFLDQGDHRRHVFGGPGCAPSGRRARFRRIGSGLRISAMTVVDIGHGDGEAGQHMGALAGLASS